MLFSDSVLSYSSVKHLYANIANKPKMKKYIKHSYATKTFQV